MRPLAKQAAALYEPHDRFARHFTRGKLQGDPVFRHLLRQGLIPSGARVLDLGCGHGALAALLVAARELHARGQWPGDWPAPPELGGFHGIDIARRDVDRAARACRGRATFEHGDIRATDLPPSDVAVILDVLHYIDHESQEGVLRKVRAALAGGGTLLLRVADADGSPRFRCTALADRLAMLLRGRGVGRLHWRRLAEWRRLLETLGFEVQASPMSEGTPFANVLLVARYHPRQT